MIQHGLYDGPAIHAHLAIGATGADPFKKPYEQAKLLDDAGASYVAFVRVGGAQELHTEDAARRRCICHGLSLLATKQDGTGHVRSTADPHSKNTLSLYASKRAEPSP